MSAKLTYRGPIGIKEYYPENTEDLQSLIDTSLKKFSKSEIKSPAAIIAPSASYKIAMDAYAAGYSKLIDEKYSTVIIISPVHKIAFPYIALTEKDYFTTPLGDLYIDSDANKILKTFDKENIKVNDKYHSAEHSIELQLPFISAIFKNKVKILPIIMGEQNTKFSILLSEAINTIVKKIKKKYLIVVASNLSYDVKYDEAVELDKKFVEALYRFNPDHLSELLAMNQIKAKGGGCIVVLQRYAKLAGIQNVEVLNYFNSGDITGNKGTVEGYISGVFW